MRHLRPRLRTDDRWDYTVDQKDGGGRPIGYCDAYKPFTDEFLSNIGLPRTHVSVVRYDEHQAKHQAKHHTDGHATEEEACECYRQYLLDHDVQVHKDSNTMRKCVVCSDFTIHWVTIGQCRLYVLCQQHQDRASPGAGDGQGFRILGELISLCQPAATAKAEAPHGKVNQWTSK